MAEYSELSSSSLGEEEERVIEQYHMKGTIGYGSFGYVNLACHRLTDTEVAVKILRKGEFNRHQIKNELDIVKAVHHPHVISLYQVMEKDEHVYLVMELAAKGDLLGWIRKSSRLFEDEARRLFKQIVSAVRYFHRNGIAHRDLKPTNILLDAHGNAKVSDFSLSIRMTPGQLLKDVCGALVFRPPEMFLHENYDGCKMDIWSLGVLLYFMVTGKFPFSGMNVSQIRVLVLEARYIAPFYLSAKGRNIIFQLLTVNPEQRPNIEQIVKNPWLNQVGECVPLPDEPLSNELDPIIVAVMCDMGYSLAEICKSILNRAFNEAMGTYLIIKEHLKKNVSRVKVKTVPLTVPPCPTPADLSTFPLPPRRTASLPARLRAIISPEFHLFCDDKQSPMKRGQSATLPAIPLCFLQKNPSPSYESMTSHYCSFLLNSKERCGPEENTLSSGQQNEESTDSSLNDDRWGWRRVARSVATTLGRIFCCVQVPK
ncbi:sperm motility kinase Z-like [Thomomys bottae]